MVKRVASAVMWFLAVSAGFEYLSLITGVPSVIGLPIAACVSAFFGIDPLHRIGTDPPRLRTLVARAPFPPARRCGHRGDVTRGTLRG